MKLLLLPIIAPLLLGSCKEHATPLEAANRELLQENTALHAKVEKLERQNDDLARQLDHTRKMHESAIRVGSKLMGEKHDLQRDAENAPVTGPTE